MKNADPELNTDEVRIVLVDDHELIRAGIRSLIGEKDGFLVVGEANDKSQAASVVQCEQPDVVLLNMELQAGDGLELISAIHEACETARVVVLTDSQDPETHRKAAVLGAIGIVSKERSPDLLMKAIARVHAGEAWLDRSITASVLVELSPRNKNRQVSHDEKKIATLTGREQEVIKLVGEGLKNKQIAERLFISDITVHHHLTSIYSKLEVTDRLELVIYAYRNGLATLPAADPKQNGRLLREPATR
jgi:two-component system, NarL family, nitrate/nitrite response regulator NarL